ncbi:MAG: hypothetical protein L6R38_005962 [Xanthoria sp. 2 TBL-2021]|nr:MAG: hypothetical protein L6R38_005962 [Xanthoria sp. 2 TBL-2021]
MRSLELEDNKPASLRNTLKPSRAWIFHSTSPLQLRSRLSKTYTLIQSSPNSPLPQKRRSCPTDLWTGENTRTPASPSPNLKPSTAITPPPPYRNLLPPKAASLAEEEADTTIFNPKYAQQSLFLLQTSLQEHAQDPTFARQLYIHAVVYLLQGLPPSSSLSESEKTSVGSAVPQCLILPSASAYNVDDDESKTTTNTGRKCDNDNANKTSSLNDDNQTPTPTTTLLHRALLSTIVLIIIFIQFLSPYIHNLFSALRHYDREYNVQGRICSFLAAIARRVWDLLASAVDPQYLVWFAAEVSAGVAEGWRQGMRR